MTRFVEFEDSAGHLIMVDGDAVELIYPTIDGRGKRREGLFTLQFASGLDIDVRYPLDHIELATILSGDPQKVEDVVGLSVQILRDDEGAS